MAAKTTVLMPDRQARSSLLKQAVALVNDLFTDLANWPVFGGTTSERVRARLARFDFTQANAATTVLDEVHILLRDHSVHVGHPRSFGLFNPTPSFMGVLADLLVAAFNPQVGAWHQNPAAVEIERHLIRFFAAEFGLPDSAYGHFTSGGSEANFSGVVVALTRVFPSFAERGLRALDGQPTFYCSQEFHHSFEKIAHQCGLGRAAVRLIPVTPSGGMDATILERTVVADRQQGLRPFLAVGTAGTTNAGVVDPLTDIANVCTRHGLHFHVDAAWGGSVILSPQLRGLLKGIERADSLTFDPHKMLSVPMGAGMFLCARRDDLSRTFSLDPAYVPKSAAPGMDNYRLSAQFSRRFIGLKLFMTLAVVGRDGYAQTIERQVAMGRHLATCLIRDGWRVVNEPQLALVCFLDPLWPDITRAAARYEAIAQQVIASGEAWVSTTRIGEQSVMRACVTSYLTDEDDIERGVAALRHARESVATHDMP